MALCLWLAAAPAAAPLHELPQIPILMYHEISTAPTSWNHGTISPDKFRSDLKTLADHGYTPIFFSDVDLARTGKQALPDKPVLITFDDGYFCNYEFAYPILKEMNMKATFSIIGWSVGRHYRRDGVTAITPHFSWDEAKEMVDSGVIEIQHHSNELHNQTEFRKGAGPYDGESKAEFRERFRKDTLALKREIESRLGKEVMVYTYPYGFYSEDTEAVLKELGFRYSLTVVNGVSDFSQSTYLLKRINVPCDLSGGKLIQAMEQ